MPPTMPWKASSRRSSLGRCGRRTDSRDPDAVGHLAHGVLAPGGCRYRTKNGTEGARAPATSTTTYATNSSAPASAWSWMFVAITAISV